MKGQDLRAYVKTFYDLQDMRVATSNRLRHLEDDSFLKSQLHKTEDLEEQAEEMIEWAVEQFDFYEDYLSQIKGIGPMMGAVILSELALPRRFERVEGRDGRPRRHEDVIEETDDGWLVQCPPSFEVASKVSQIWSYCGYGDPNEKRTKGESASHNPFIKKKLHTISVGFLRGGSYYREYYDDAKEYYVAERDWNDGHCHMAALRVVKKLFLSHAWEVWRTRRDLECPEPYVFDKQGHDGYIPPFVEDGMDVIDVL